MYNLLIVAEHGAWDSGVYYLRDRGRFLEHTEPLVRQQFSTGDDARIVAGVCAMPALFMYEKQFPAPGWRGTITALRMDPTGVAVQFTIARQRAFTWPDLNPYLVSLDISPFELNRSHWAIKNADLDSVLQRLQPPLKAFVSYKWESEEHSAWVRRLAAALRSRGIDVVLDQWEVRFGDSFTDYMQTQIAGSDVVLFVITPASVAAAEAPSGHGGALKFEVQMMNARRISDGTPVIGIYRSGERAPHYLRDHRYVDFREDDRFDSSIDELVNDLLGKSGPPPLFHPR